MIRHLLSRYTHKLHALPVLVLMPHSRCNCRCVMCDIWKANHNKQEISAETLAQHVEAFRRLGVKHVALSGGEALMHSNLWAFCDELKKLGVKLSLLSTGITLKQNAEKVAAYFDDVVVSIDGSEEVHNTIRNLPVAYGKLKEGIAALRSIDSKFRITGRCVLQRLNFRDFPNIVQAALDLKLDQISFLAADVSTSAFNRDEPWASDKIVQIELNHDEVAELEIILSNSFETFSTLYENKFIAERPSRMMGLAKYYKALLNEGDFPAKRCNAPWVSAVIESDGEVRPCFFHASYGNIYRQNFQEIVNSPAAISFRKSLDMRTDPVCERCVCSLYRPAF